MYTFNAEGEKARCLKSSMVAGVFKILNGFEKLNKQNGNLNYYLQIGIFIVYWFMRCFILVITIFTC